MQGRPNIIKRLSLLISAVAAVFIIGVVVSRIYFTTTTTVTSSRATALPAPTFNAALLNVLIHDSYYGDADTNLTNPPVWTVPANSDVIVTIENKGTLKHNWAIVKKGASVPAPYEEGQAGNILLYGVGMVYHNSQTTATFTAPEPGEYMVICTVSGHYPKMQGRLIVK
ncbi:MAG: sulfocyanin-like copper-binding protein [Chloroflexi bacterium]|nr:sulfocyanin-like copper-binding protein [Chloroflexota bacterium]